jgi:hypothetical protein
LHHDSLVNERISLLHGYDLDCTELRLGCRYEEFGECFSLWCDEKPDGAVAVFNTVSRHMEKLMVVSTITLFLAHARRSYHAHFPYQDKYGDLFAEYNLQHNIDVLHAVVTEARARKQQYLLQQQQGDETGKDAGVGNDVWREDLLPRAAVRARTVPLLEEEATRLRATLEEVRCSSV